MCAGQHALGNVGRGAEGRLSSIARAKVSPHPTFHLLSHKAETARHAVRSCLRPPHTIHSWESKGAPRSPSQHLIDTGAHALCIEAVDV